MKLYKKDGHFWLDFRNHKGRRCRIGTRVSSKSVAESIARQVHDLLALRTGNQPLSPELQKWIEGVDCKMREALARFDLIEQSRAAGGQPLSEIIDVFAQWIENKGSTAKQAGQQKTRVNRVLLIECGFTTFSDIDAGRVSTALAAMRTGADAISSRTVNFHLQACQQFCRWAVRNKLTTANPIEHLTPMKRDKSEELKRRALSAQEVTRLLSFTRSEPKRFTMSGAERALVYQLGIESGLRYSEIQSLTAGDFDLAGHTQYEKVSALSREVKVLAMNLNIPILALCQLNRMSAYREDGRPSMSELRDSGSLEQDADGVMLLHREDVHKRNMPGYTPDGKGQLIIAKNRRGPCGIVELVFDEELVRFEEIEAVNE